MPSRCILLFSRGAKNEARAKRMPNRQLFDIATRRIERIARVAGVDLVAPRIQRGISFGERLENAFRDAAARYDEIVIVPIDVPQLTARDVTRAFALLGNHDLVLGPCHDGGVYLIAGRANAADRFASVRWLTQHVLDDLGRGNVALLDPLADIDAPEDVAKVAGFLPASLVVKQAWLVAPDIRRDGDSVADIDGRGPPR